MHEKQTLSYILFTVKHQPPATASFFIDCVVCVLVRFRANEKSTHEEEKNKNYLFHIL